MDRALFAAATGMAAQQQNLDTIANNLANADVVGFKGSADDFAALAAPGQPGSGTVRTREHAVFVQGKLERSNGPFDVAIDGPGFFSVSRGGERGFTRDGSFARAADGTLQTASGWELTGVHIPADARTAVLRENGEVEITTAKGRRTIARVRIATFQAPERLRTTDGTLFLQTRDSGAPRMVAPGLPNGSALRFGMLEQSNVSIIESMMQILTAQRAYEANAKGIQAADEMLRIANNLQRG
jgi:flagellar basal-body rod protein FlgG